MTYRQNSKPLSEEDMLKIERYKKDRVTIRIWTSLANINNHDKSRTDDNCGHVSVETILEGKCKYMSLWPVTPPSKDELGIGVWKKTVKPHFMASYESDVKAENGHEPDVVIHFYTLKKDKIFKKFEKLEKTCGGWSMLGFKNSQSCASAAWLLLVAGDKDTNYLGIGTKTQTFSIQSGNGSSVSSTNSTSSYYQQSSKASIFSVESVVMLLGIESPDMLAEKLRLAKNKEKEKYPLTEELPSGNEKNVQSHSYCCIL